MGLLGDIADTVADVGGTVLDAAPIPGSDIAAKGVETVQGALGGSPGSMGHGDILGGGGGSSNLPQQMQQDPGQGQQQIPGDFGFQTGGSMNLPGLPQTQGGMQFGVGGGDGQQSAAGANLPANFSQGLMLSMLQDSVTSKSGRAVIEAMVHGSLQGGMIQQPQRVETPRGPRHFSPPGFRTVTIQDQKIAVFKPLAKALGLLPKGERSFLQKIDDAARTFNKYRRRYKKLSSKLGFKSPKSRKSGPKR